jgi:formate hydrogenlyase subunit 6/NADH:ubiquinone oxidoreductase subunit I
MGMFSQSEWAWNFLRKGYSFDIDREICSKCGLCAKLCPVNNIVMNEYPEYKEHCCICMRCVAFCPTKAIYATKAHFVSHKKGSDYYTAVKASELLSDKQK